MSIKEINNQISGLNNQIAELKKQRDKLIEDGNREWQDKYANAITQPWWREAVDLFCPNHDCINCDDDNLASGYIDHNRPRCLRCYLLKLIKDNYVEDGLRFVLKCELSGL